MHATNRASTARGAPSNIVAPMHYQCTRHAPRLQPVCFKPNGTPESVASIVSKQADIVQLGKSQLRVPALGVGTWSWGDSMGYWGYGVEYGKDQSREAFKALLGAGLTFMDTAEAYGKSEEFLGEFIKEAGPAGEAVQVATKFTPWPTRFSPKSVPDALKASLARLQRPSVQLYMQHFPGFFNAAYVEGLAMCKQQGLCEAVGVSNFNAKRVKETARSLEALGVPLAVNQVHYSLLYRAPETNGVLEACREHGVTLVAYSPMAQGLLTGKYQPGSGTKPFGARAKLFTEARLIEVQPLLSAMKAIGDEREKTMAQVAINWLICKGVVPIPGAKNAKQVAEVAGALGWRLSEGEVAELDRQSKGLTPSKGAPLENI